MVVDREPTRVAAAQPSSKGGDEPLQQTRMPAEATLHRIGDDISRWAQQCECRPVSLPKVERLTAAVAARPAIAPVWSRHFVPYDRSAAAIRRTMLADGEEGQIRLLAPVPKCARRSSVPGLRHVALYDGAKALPRRATPILDATYGGSWSTPARYPRAWSLPDRPTSRPEPCDGPR